MFERIEDLALCKMDLVDELRLPLINRFYSACNYRVKCGRFERTYSLSYKNRIIAAARLIPQSSGDFLLRNLCVAPEFRHQGVASFFIPKLVSELAPGNCYCFALPHLEKFYLSLSFSPLNYDQVPFTIGEMLLRHRDRKRGWLLMGYVNC